MWAVRDPTATDPGITDRRLLAFEAEFASALKAVTRDNSTLSATLRSAWDGRPLQLLTRTAPARASDAHVTVIGHITATELRHYLTGLELANGLANRFLLICCRRDPAPARRRSQRPARRHRPYPTARGRDRARPHRRPSCTSTSTRANSGITPTRSSPAPARPGSLVRSAPAPKHTSSGSRSSTRSPTARRTINTEHLPSGARALGLRRPLSQLGTKRRDRRPARRTGPRRTTPSPARRADPQPDQRHPAAQPPRRADPTRARHAHARRPRDPRPDPDRRPTRRALDRRTSTRR